MYSKFSILFFYPILALTGLLASQSVKAQTISGIFAVETCVPITYTITGFTLPAGATFNRYDWALTYNAPSSMITSPSACGGTINSIITNTFSAFDINTNSILVSWGDFFAPCVAKIEASIVYTLNDKEVVLKASGNVSIRAVYSLGYISGPANIQTCCSSPVTYTVVDYDKGPGNTTSGFAFNWTVAGGTITSGQGTNTITVTPGPSANVAVNCTVRRSASGGPTRRTFVFTSTRKSPSINISSGPSGKNNICPGQILNYTALASACGITNINWTVPATWQILSGNGTNTLTVQAGVAGSSGNIVATATYSGGCTATANFVVDVLLAAPATPQIQWNSASGDYTYYHCGDWYICPRDGEAQISALIKPGTQSIRWEIAPPWRFDGGYQVIEQSVNIVNEQYVFSPYIEADCDVMTGGSLRVKASNCLGTSNYATVNFKREISQWCRSGCLHTCYPSEEPCIGVSPDYECSGPYEMTVNDNDAQFTDQQIPDENDLTLGNNAATEMLSGLLVYPNPGNGHFHIVSETPVTNIQVFNTNGVSIFNQRVNDNLDVDLDIHDAPDGIYLLEIMSQNATTVKRLVIQRR